MTELVPAVGNENTTKYKEHELGLSKAERMTKKFDSSMP